MTTSATFSADLDTLRDPRYRPDFQPKYYPAANGKSAPADGAKEKTDQIKLEFLAVYYWINREYEQLVEIRGQSKSSEDAARERQQLAVLDQWLTIRDQLEDRYASFGTIADPVVKNGFAVDIKFSFGKMDELGRRRSGTYQLSAYIPIPMPEGMKLEDLPMNIEGPGILRD